MPQFGSTMGSFIARFHRAKGEAAICNTYASRSIATPRPLIKTFRGTDETYP
jgi:hypothetical protein